MKQEPVRYGSGLDIETPLQLIIKFNIYINGMAIISCKLATPVSDWSQDVQNCKQLVTPILQKRLTGGKIIKHQENSTMALHSRKMYTLRIFSVQLCSI